jgi:hypothetical protein
MSHDTGGTPAATIKNSAPSPNEDQARVEMITSALLLKLLN